MKQKADGSVNMLFLCPLCDNKIYIYRLPEWTSVDGYMPFACSFFSPLIHCVGVVLKDKDLTVLYLQQNPLQFDENANTIDYQPQKLTSVIQTGFLNAIGD